VLVLARDAVAVAAAAATTTMIKKGRPPPQCREPPTPRDGYCRTRGRKVRHGSSRRVLALPHITEKSKKNCAKHLRESPRETVGMVRYNRL
jgi:hypothetical protein